MNNAAIDLLAETSRLTGLTVEPEYPHATLAPLEEHQGDDDSQPVEHIG